ncbi:type 2 lanthipeptide synthetase LanM [Streptomyces sp. NPDC058579]|uniref:type 2 lanthipeptide synthetase LanM n=1 Tax=Streptomyces sp. NPDC058579 TaxID=3346548 RepID=UPI0036481C1B
MKSHDDHVISELLRTYLPELSSPELVQQVEARLRAVPGRGAGTDTGPGPRDEGDRSAEPAVPAPSAYDPALDTDGLFHDYFAHFVEPWADLVREGVRSSAVVAGDNTIVVDFMANQRDLVCRTLIRTLVEELYQRRSRGLLDGRTTQERYAAFRRWTNSEAGHRSLNTSYPGLFQTVDRRVGASAHYVLRVLAEVDDHAAQVADLLPAPLGPVAVTRISLGEGDTHNGGTSVAQIAFSGGGRVLYKPHPMDAEAGYQDFVSWINGCLGTDLPTVRILPTAQGGFASYVPTEAYRGEQRDYFARIGTIAGVLHLLKATDIHFENVVSCAAGPVVIDTETLLSPRLNAPAAYDDGAASKIGALALQESIIGSGLLPLVVRAGETGPGLDIGAIGYDSGQRAPYKSLSLNNAGRDDMSLTMVNTHTTAANANLSVGRATELPVGAQRDAIKAEFRRVLEFAAAHRDEVMAAIETCLGDARFRHVNQATIFYAQLLRMATHPDALADPQVRAAVLHRAVLRTGDNLALADEEVRQMGEGDIPYFSYSARSRALHAGGRVVRADAFTEPPLETVRARIHALDDETIARELRLIDYSFVSKLPTDQEETGFAPLRAPGLPAVRVGRPRLLGEAERIGEDLLTTLVASTDPRHPATWIAPQVTTDSQSQWSPGTLGFDLYGGSPGPALVLAGLARATGRSDFADAARRVLDPVEEQLRGGHLAAMGVSVGGMTGLAGTAYALVVARELLDEPDPERPADLAVELARCCGADVGTDYLSGMAGARTAHARPRHGLTVTGGTLLSHIRHALAALASPPRPPAAREGHRVTPEALGWLEARTQALERYENGAPVSLPALYLAARTEYQQVTGLLADGGYDGATGARLLLLGARAATVCGWLSSTLGEEARAERYDLAAIRAATAAGSRRHVATYMSQLAIRHLIAGAAHDALQLAHAARAVVQRPSGTFAVSLHVKEALALARLNEPTATDRALGQARDAFERHTPDERPATAPADTIVDETYLDIGQGNAFLYMGRPRKALPCFASLFDHTPHHAPASPYTARRLLYVVDVQLALGDVDAATRSAHRATALTGQLPPGLARQYGQRFAPHRTRPAVGDLLDQLSAPAA